MDVAYPKDRDYSAERAFAEQAGDEGLEALFGLGEAGDYIPERYIDNCIELAKAKRAKR